MDYKFHFDLSLGAILTLIFVLLKITHFIDWSWIWVFSPLWISAIVVIVLFLIFLIIQKVTTKRWF